MPQGGLKLKAGGPGSAGRAPADKKSKNSSRAGAAASCQPKRGRTVIPPKKPALIKHKMLQKKLSAGINRTIEKQMATKAGATGKLTIMKSLAEAGAKEADEKAKKK